MKNLVKILLIVVAVSGLCGCGNNTQNDMTQNSAAVSAGTN